MLRRDFFKAMLVSPLAPDDAPSDGENPMTYDELREHYLKVARFLILQGVKYLHEHPPDSVEDAMELIRAGIELEREAHEGVTVTFDPSKLPTTGRCKCSWCGHGQNFPAQKSGQRFVYFDPEDGSWS